MGLDIINGRMGKLLKEIGKKERETVKEKLLLLKDKLIKASGVKIS